MSAGQFGIVRVRKTGAGVNSELPAFNGRGRGAIRNRPARLLPPAHDATNPHGRGGVRGCTWVYMGCRNHECYPPALDNYSPPRVHWLSFMAALVHARVAGAACGLQGSGLQHSGLHGSARAARRISTGFNATEQGAHRKQTLRILQLSVPGCGGRGYPHALRARISR